MKTLLTAALGLMISASAFSQDTLFTRNGEVILAKVQEISATDIKYKKPSNPDGPLYVISKDEIAVIEYKNGTKDVFLYSGGQQQPAAGSNSSDPSANQGNSSGTQQPPAQVNNYYGGSSYQRPGVNVVLGMGGFWGVPYWGGGWGWYRPYYRPYYRSWGGWHGGGYYGGGWHHGGYGGHGHHHR
jgi:hypothetical protein